jgi:hypothetical protein
MPESHWIAKTVEMLDNFLHSKIVRTWLPRELLDELFACRADLLRKWDATRGCEQLLQRQYDTNQIAA